MTASEILGYIASLTILIGMTMTSLMWLRIVGLIGSLCFTIYGVLIGAWPVTAANGLIAAAHAYHLRKLVLVRETFSLLSVDVASQWYFDRFLSFYEDDIKRSHPRFDAAAIPRDRRGFFILRDLVPVGLLLYTEEGRDLRIHLDYVIPDYRDLKNAHFAYGELDRLLEGGRFERWRVRPDAEIHDRYFRRLGFHPVDEKRGELARPLGDALPA